MMAKMHLQGNQFSINVDDLNAGLEAAYSRSGGRRPIDLYVTGNQLSGTMMRTEQSSKLAVHDWWPWDAEAATMSGDIERLFHLLPDPIYHIDTQRLFGYRTYEEFLIPFPAEFPQKQKEYLLNRGGVGFEQDSYSVTSIGFRDHELAYLNWDVLQHFQGLLEFEFVNCGLESLNGFVIEEGLGSLPLDKLPRGLLKFNMEGNKLWGPINLGHLPPRLRELRLMRNRLTGTLNFCSVPAVPKSVTVELWNFEGNQFTEALFDYRYNPGLKVTYRKQFQKAIETHGHF